MADRNKRPKQNVLDFPNSWGGARANSGPKPRNGRSGVAHREREALASRFPVLVTMRIAKGLPSLRRKLAHRALLEAFAGANERGGLRITQYSVQSNHLHLIVEARDRSALSRGMQGLSVRVARGLNRLWKRVGSVFADRYHDRILRTPREVRNALAYVLNNSLKHGLSPSLPDRYSSGATFEGWREFEPRQELTKHGPVAAAMTWLQRVGWRRHGLLSPFEIPALAAARRAARA